MFPREFGDLVSRAESEMVDGCVREFLQGNDLWGNFVKLHIAY